MWYYVQSGFEFILVVSDLRNVIYGVDKNCDYRMFQKCALSDKFSQKMTSLENTVKQMVDTFQPNDSVGR